MKRILKRILTFLLCAALLVGGVVFGSRLYRLLDGRSNVTWVSERFAETLAEKRELVVLEKSITGQENVSTDAWLIGTVREVIIPYTFSVSFSVDMEQADVQYDEAGNVLKVLLPLPVAKFYKLTVDEENVQKKDLFYPLTSDRYTQMKQELEEKLYDEVTHDVELQESAWSYAVSETKALYQALLDANGGSASLAIQVVPKETQAAE